MTEGDKVTIKIPEYYKELGIPLNFKNKEATVISVNEKYAKIIFDDDKQNFKYSVYTNYLKPVSILFWIKNERDYLVKNNVGIYSNLCKKCNLEFKGTKYHRVCAKCATK